MPTPIPQSYTTNFLSIVQVISLPLSQRLQEILVNYEDIVTALGYLTDQIDASPSLLNELIACFPDSRPLNAAGIYVGVTQGTVFDVTYEGISLFINWKDLKYSPREKWMVLL